RLKTYPRAPAASAASISSGAFATEQITTAHGRLCRAISLVTSIPFNSGMLRSRTATEGCNRQICSRADRPLAAVAITLNSCDRADTSANRALWLSSAIRIRNFILEACTEVRRISSNFAPLRYDKSNWAAEKQCSDILNHSLHISVA